MYKKITFYIISVFLLGLFAFPALAQEAEALPDPGLLPDSPFYFVKTLFEDIGTFFVFSDIAKAERYQELAQKRIAEVEVMAQEGKTENIEKALERYQNQLEKSLENIDKVRERNKEKEQERISQITEKIAENTVKCYRILNEDLGEVSEKAREVIRETKRVSSDSQIEVLRSLVNEKTDKVMEIYQEALQVRINSIDTGVDYDDLESTNDAVEEYKKYANFGQEISELAKGIRIGETTVEELVERATSNSARVLEQVKARVSEQARNKIQDAVNTTEQVRERVESQIRVRVEAGEVTGEQNQENRIEEGVCVENCDESGNEENGNGNGNGKNKP